MDIATLAKARYVSLTTFKRDGTPVSTPVWVATDDGALLVHSYASSWKVKRIRRDHHVRVAPCNARGVLRGDALDADATIDGDTRTVSMLLARKYWLMFRVVAALNAVLRKLRGRPRALGVTIRVTPHQTG
jgi:uncharacterized protein